MTPNEQPAKQNEIKSVNTNYDFIEALYELDGTSVSELANRLGTSKSTVHSHLTTLKNRGYIVEEDGTYSLGLRFLTLGGFVQSKSRLYSIARPEIESFVTEYGIKSTLMVEEHGRGICLYQRRGDNAIYSDSHIGTRVYLHCTALGKAFLSAVSEKRVNEIVERHGLPARTDQTITDRKQLDAVLQTVAERGYAIDDQERISGIRCVAAPIVTDDGEPLGSLSVSGSIKNLSMDSLNEDLAQAVQEAARVVSINYMYSK